MILKRKNITRLTDEDLMLAIKNGNQAAFTELYSRFNKRLYYYFYRMLASDIELANDFLQDIFLKIVHKPELYNPEYKFSNWIFSVAHNMCKNEYRKREVRKIVQSTENPDQYIEELSANTTIDKENLIADVFNELKMLDENQRSILILKYKENFSIKEISAILELPIGTIKSRLYYARLELSKRVANKQIL